MMRLKTSGVAEEQPLRQGGDETDDEETDPDVIECHGVVFVE